MIRRYVSAIACLVGILFVLPCVRAETDGPYTYIVTNGMATITEFDHEYSGALNITNALGGCPVTVIGDMAIGWCKGITSVTIPDSVTNIGWSSFSGCDGLVRATIPAGVANIGPAAFTFCHSLTGLVVAVGNANYSSLNGDLFNADKTTLVQCVGGKTGEYAVPDGVTRIGSGSFAGCAALTRVTLPNSVTTVGVLAFNVCSNLTSVTMGAGVNSIEGSAFEACYSLQHVFFAGNAPGFDEYVFDWDSSVTLYYFPGTTGWGATHADRPAVLWSPTFTGVVMGPDTVSCTVTGTPGIPVALEVSTNLLAGGWVRLEATNITDGTINLVDAAGTNVMHRFYRIAGP